MLCPRPKMYSLKSYSKRYMQLHYRVLQKLLIVWVAFTQDYHVICGIKTAGIEISEVNSLTRLFINIVL